MSRKRSRISPATVLFALVSLVLAILLYVRTHSPNQAPLERPLRPGVSASPRSRPRIAPPSRAAAPSRPSLRSTPAREAAARIAIVIDDLGNDPAAVDRIARWPQTVTVAILPGLPGSARAAREIESSGKEVLLHLPMEPKGFPAVRPGPGVLLRAQSYEEIARIVESDLDSVPGAVGVNNHMGSAATADPRVMGAVMGVLARRGLFFVDSRTTNASVAEEEARAAGVPAVSRRVFLDDVATERAVEKALGELAGRGRSEGFAVGIGHPHSATLTVLERELPNLEKNGVRLVRVGELVK